MRDSRSLYYDPSSRAIALQGGPCNPRYFEKRGKIICSVHIISRHCGGGPALEREIQKRMCYLKKDPLSVYICEILKKRNIISTYSRNLSTCRILISMIEGTQNLVLKA